MKSHTEVGDLVGEKIDGIGFVLDFVEVQLNGAILRCFSRPKLTYKGETTIFPDPGSRDALCTMIGSSVIDVKLVEDKHLKLTTDKGHLFEVPLASAPESLHFIPRGPQGKFGPMQVFN